MAIKHFFSGMFVKAITGFDDTLVHIPIVANITHTRLGRIIFSIGILLAISLAILLSFLFASAIKLIPYYHYISAGLILFLAISIYFDLFVQNPKKKMKAKVKKTKTISPKRVLKLIGIGFLTAFATVIDDTIAYSSLFLGDLSNAPYVISGIFYVTLLELFVIISFSKKISKIKFKKEITVIGLIILSLLIFLRIL